MFRVTVRLIVAALVIVALAILFQSPAKSAEVSVYPESDQVRLAAKL
jgi:hypothetical protein